MNKVLWVIGGRQGLGAQIALDGERLTGGRYELIISTGAEVDMTQPDEIGHFSKAMADQHGSYDMVYCAGYNNPRPIGQLSTMELPWHFEVNVMGFIYAINSMKHCVDPLRKVNVVAIVSDASKVAMRNSIAYCSSKAALAHAVKCAARELAPMWRVNGVSPGIIAATPMTDRLDNLIPAMRGWSPEQARAYEKSMIPMGRRAAKVEVSSLVHQILAGPEYMTGTVVDITGGK